MKFTYTHESVLKIKSDILVIPCWQKIDEKNKDDKGIAVISKGSGHDIDKLMGGLLSKIIKDEKFSGETADYRIVYTGGKIPAKAVILAGYGKLKDYTMEISRKVGAKVTEVAEKIKAKSLSATVWPEKVNGLTSAQRVTAFIEGLLLGSYRFEIYKDKKDREKKTLNELILSVKSERQKIEAAINKAIIISENVMLARDMVNTPAKDMTPEDVAKKGREIAKKHGLACTVWGKKEISREKMGLLLAVAKGSENEPKFVHIRYKPGKSKTKIALIGKGVTFDSGGYELKPGRHMLNMKEDMAGAATCLAVLNIAAELKLPVEIDLYIPATDNMIDAKAEVPGNVVRSRNGKTVEIISTDSEGRLVLADAIAFSLEKKPDYIIDVATLTGGVLYALGELYTAVLGNDQKFIDRYLKAAKEEEEPAWQLPLAKEYKKGLTDGIADLKNSAKTHADTIAGALFLHEFVGKTKWIHLDIAETSWASEDRDYVQLGGTGATVRSIVKLIEDF